MARKIVLGYSLPNLAALAATGAEFELSAIPINGEHEVFFREIGKIDWAPVVAVTKKKPLAYRSEAIGALILHVTTELPGAPLRIYYCNRVFVNGEIDPVSALLQERYAALADTYRPLLFQLLGIAADHPNPLWMLEQTLTYPSLGHDSMKLNLIQTCLSLPVDWAILLPPSA
jgi:hypothetical protein